MLPTYCYLPSYTCRPRAGASCENITTGVFWQNGDASTANTTIATADECCASCQEDAQCVRFMLVPGESGQPTTCYLWYFLGAAPNAGSSFITIGYGERPSRSPKQDLGWLRQGMSPPPCAARD